MKSNIIVIIMIFDIISTDFQDIALSVFKLLESH